MRRWGFLLGLGACLFVAAACGHSPSGPDPTPPPGPGPNPPPVATPPTLGVTRILGFGDSMTEGTTSPSLPVFGALTAGIPESYPYKLKALMTARYTAQTITVLNGGHAGEYTSQGRDRLGGVLSEARPEVMILMEGANDLNAMNGAGLTDIGPVVNDMEDMVSDASGRGIQVIVATLPPQRAGGRNAGAGPLLAKYNGELKTMASRKGAMLVDLNALFPVSLIGQDGLHPTEGGYQKFAEIFFDAIKGRWEVPSTSVRR